SARAPRPSTSFRRCPSRRNSLPAASVGARTAPTPACTCGASPTRPRPRKRAPRARKVEWLEGCLLWERRKPRQSLPAIDNAPAALENARLAPAQVAELVDALVSGTSG